MFFKNSSVFFGFNEILHILGSILQMFLMQTTLSFTYYTELKKFTVNFLGGMVCGKFFNNPCKIALIFLIIPCHTETFLVQLLHQK